MCRRSTILLIGIFVVVGCAAVCAPRAYGIKSMNSNRPGWWRVKAAYPVFTATGAVARAASVGFRADVKRLVGDFTKPLSQGSRPERGAECEYELSPQICIVRPELISGYHAIYENTWGAHPNHSYLARTYGKINGKAVRLCLRDTLKPGVKPGEFADDVILRELNVLKRQRGVETVGSIDVALVNNFVVTPAGITVIFPAYAVGVYAEGDYFVKLPWSKLRGYVNPSGPLGKVMVPAPAA